MLSVNYIPFTENADGTHTFTVPVEALDSGIACAAFSKKKEIWYDRTLVFRADSLPMDARSDDAYTTVESLQLASMNFTTGIPPKMAQTFLCAKPKKGSGNAALQTRICMPVSRIFTGQVLPCPAALCRRRSTF